ncbi:MAG: DJ-1/PfpI family protein [Saccharospirillaceae bacterium]|nr:DJ-1/PfpI family protein [Pseudomonadales bacterium]NRB77551.1 DJ-1/PfpI family protein [Saccharospirillaceae bacterium]
MTINIAIIAFNNVEELDLVGPWEVFQEAANLDKRFQTQVISLDGKGVMAAKGLFLGVHGSMQTNKKYDVIVLPGGVGTDALIQNKTFLECLTTLTTQATWVTSVCTGSFVYAHMGLLKGRKCTTYYDACYGLETKGQTGEVLRNTRFVQDGHVVTAAGVSAGIDMSLWLIGQLMTTDFARDVQQKIEYFPEPPYQNDNRI